MKRIALYSFILGFLLSGCQTQHTQQNPTLTMPKLSVQLWSVKDPLAQNFDQTIAELAKMGFDGVELAGYFGPYQNNSKGLLTLLAEHNLMISSAHVGIENLATDNIDQTISFYQALGVSTLIIPWEERAFNSDKVEELIQDLKRIQQKLTTANIRLGFHNHVKEFNAYNNSTFWDAIAQATDNNFILQLDIGWVNKAGKNPVTYINKYPGRTKLAHFKAKLREPAANKLPLIGQDDIDWHAVLDASVNQGGIEWLVLEQEDYPLDLSPLAAVAQSKLGIDNIIKAYNEIEDVEIK